jgi:hypothetical protein
MARDLRLVEGGLYQVGITRPWIHNLQRCHSSCFLDSQSLNRVMEDVFSRPHHSELAPGLLMMLMDCSIAQTHPLTVFFICCIVKLPLFCQLPPVSAYHWLTATSAKRIVVTGSLQECLRGCGV